MAVIIQKLTIQILQQECCVLFVIFPWQNRVGFGYVNCRCKFHTPSNTVPVRYLIYKYQSNSGILSLSSTLLILPSSFLHALLMIRSLTRETRRELSKYFSYFITWTGIISWIIDKNAKLFFTFFVVFQHTILHYYFFFIAVKNCRIHCFSFIAS